VGPGVSVTMHLRAGSGDELLLAHGPVHAWTGWAEATSTRVPAGAVSLHCPGQTMGAAALGSRWPFASITYAVNAGGPVRGNPGRGIGNVRSRLAGGCGGNELGPPTGTGIDGPIIAQ
jgi:hypothetical protein